MQRDLWKYFAILVGVALLALVVGASLMGVVLATLIAAVGIIVWQLHRINLLIKWLNSPSDHLMPEMGGLYYLLHKKLSQRNTQYAKRKRQLAGYLSQFREAVSAMPDAIVLIDSAGKIEWANTNSIELLGIRWPEDASVRFGDLIRHPEVLDILNSSKALTDIQEINSITHKNTEINLKSVPYSNSTRMIIARDVSRLIKVNQIHTDFVANVSHELKTPLTVLKGYIEIIQNSGEMPAKFSKAMEQMNLQSVRMQLIVNDLLYLAKLEDRSNKAPHQTINVVHLVNSIIESLQPLVEEKGHTITLELDQTLTINGAQTELHSALSNLIANAINYTEPHGEICVKWGRNASGAVFSVRDNGLGIPPHHIARLTQRFYRIDTDRSRESGGTGLGLAIVKHVLQRHDAELEIQSTQDVGSTFSCYFSDRQISQPIKRAVND